MSWCSLEADGVLGGILLMWDTRVLELVDSCIGSFFVLVVFKNLVDGM